MTGKESEGLEGIEKKLDQVLQVVKDVPEIKKNVEELGTRVTKLETQIKQIHRQRPAIISGRGGNPIGSPENRNGNGGSENGDPIPQFNIAVEELAYDKMALGERLTDAQKLDSLWDAVGDTREDIIGALQNLQVGELAVIWREVTGQRQNVAVAALGKMPHMRSKQQLSEALAFAYAVHPDLNSVLDMSDIH